MKHSKLTSLLRTLSKEEWNTFEDFVSSPYFNKRPELPPFCKAWRSIVAFDKEEPELRKLAYKKSFPSEKFREKQCAYLMNYLLKLTEQFLGMQKYRKDPCRHDFDKMEAMLERRQEKHYQFIYRKVKSFLEVESVEDNDYFNRQRRLSELSNRHFMLRDKRQYDNHIQDASDYLDLYYLSKKLKMLCDMANRQKLFPQSYRLNLIAEIDAFINQSAKPMPPFIMAYYYVLKMLTETAAETYFTALQKLFAQHYTVFSMEDKTNILSHSLNYCIQQIRIKTNKTPYMEEALRLYLMGIEQKIILEKGRLSPWHFKNITKLAINLKKYDWAESFIWQHAGMLDKSTRENALHYNLADLQFSRKNYDEAMHHLNQVVFTDIHYQLNAKVLLLQIFYELDEEESLLSLLASFRIFLNRNKKISPDLRKTYLNFCRLLTKLMRRQHKKLPSVLEEIKKTSPLTGREWLMEIGN